MSYDRPNRQKYTFGVFDFGAGSDDGFYINTPKGKAGRLWDYGVEGTVEVFNGNTVTPKISVGTTANVTAYGASLDLNALADSDMKSVRTLYREEVDNFTSYMTATSREIPADSVVQVRCIAGTSSATGQAVPWCIIDWQH